MSKEEILDRLRVLPKGGITTKNIKGQNGKTYQYSFLQWSENGKRYSRRLGQTEIEETKRQIQERTKLEELLRAQNQSNRQFHTNIRTGEELSKIIAPIRKYKKRKGFENLKKYVYGDDNGKVFILYGLRRTGKTTLMKQLINAMETEDFGKTAFIQIQKTDNLAILDKDLKALEHLGYRYIFIDEVTLMEDFIEGSALLSDIYASSGMKIVLSGTDSLGFALAKSNELYDRCILLHTTFIPYREFETVLGIEGIDEYIQYGGTMSLSGTHYNDSGFNGKQSTDEYVDSAIATNIQHSLKYYQDEGHFRHLYSLYEKHELTNAINRVIEDVNHRFTLEVLNKDFKSNDLAISSRNLRKDKDNPTTILDDVDIFSFTKRLMERQDIKNKDERFVKIDEVHVEQIQEYLALLDLTKEIDIVDTSGKPSMQKRTVFTQPGLRYSQAKSFVDSLSLDEEFQNLSFEERKRIQNRVLSEIKGRMMEDIVLLETKLARPDKKVFKLQFVDGEFDMVVFNEDCGGVELYEIKYSQLQVKEQVRHLYDEEKLKQTEYRFGPILKKAVIYRGEEGESFGVPYLNVERYLKDLIE